MEKVNSENVSEEVLTILAQFKSWNYLQIRPAVAYYKNNRREDAVSSFERLAGIAENSPANENSDESPRSKTDTQVAEENSLFYKTVLELASSEDSEVK